MSSDSQLLDTGIEELNRLLGGGLPTRQVLLLAGHPGSGKTIIASQIAFAQAAQGVPVLLATAASEPHTKMLDSLQSFSFFKRERVGREIFLLSVYPWLRKGVKEAREMLLSSVRERRARLLVVDGLRSLQDVWRDEASTREFLAELGVGLATHDCTGVLTFECPPHRTLETPEAATVDGVVNLFFERDAMRRSRRIEVVKVRGRRHIPGEHHAELTGDGLGVTLRLEVDALPPLPPPRSGKAPFGIADLDAFLGGGVPAGGLTFVTGGAGTGKSLVSYAFAKSAPRSLFVSFEEPEALIRSRAEAVGLGDPSGAVEVWSPDRMSLDPDRVARELLARCDARPVQRLVVDGLDVLAEAVQPERRGNFFVAFERALRARAQDVLWTAPAKATVVDEVSRTADNLIELELGRHREGLTRTLSVLKMRAASTPRSSWIFDINSRGIGPA